LKWFVLAADASPDPKTAIFVAFIAAGGSVFAAALAVVGMFIQARKRSEAPDFTKQMQWEYDKRIKAEQRVTELEEEVRNERAQRRFAERQADKLRRALEGDS
jgi:uncharacterized membrane protein